MPVVDKILYFLMIYEDFGIYSIPVILDLFWQKQSVHSQSFTADSCKKTNFTEFQKKIIHV